MATAQDVYDITTEIRRIVHNAQATGWSGADVESELGSIVDYSDQIDAAVAGLVAPPVPTPTPPDPPPAPVTHLPAAGFYASQPYGQGYRQWGNLTIPKGTPKGVLVQVHGGGWMQGDPNVALPLGKRDCYDELLCSAGEGVAQALFYGLRAMASYAAQRWGVIVWEPAYTYSTGNPDICLLDVELALAWLRGKLAEWGAQDLPVVYAGHSAGGQLALRAALDPTLPAPRAFLGMAAAGLSVHQLSDVQDAPGGFNQGGTGWIFQTAWGRDYSKWPSYAPDGHLQDREERFPLMLEQGSLNGHDDGSVNVRWAVDFATAAQRSSWPTTLHVQNGVDHFGVRWDSSPTTRGDMDAIWSSL